MALGRCPDRVELLVDRSQHHGGGDRLAVAIERADTEPDLITGPIGRLVGRELDRERAVVRSEVGAGAGEEVAGAREPNGLDGDVRDAYLAERRHVARRRLDDRHSDPGVRQEEQIPIVASVADGAVALVHRQIDLVADAVPAISAGARTGKVRSLVPREVTHALGRRADLEAREASIRITRRHVDVVVMRGVGHGEDPLNVPSGLVRTVIVARIRRVTS